jgi:hypothetical protein
MVIDENATDAKWDNDDVDKNLSDFTSVANESEKFDYLRNLSNKYEGICSCTTPRSMWASWKERRRINCRIKNLTK